MQESFKAMKRRQRDPLFTSRYFVGEGIDIGCGPDPLWNQKLWGAWPGMRSCANWDLELGDSDAQLMEGEDDEFYDFVYSSHTLEHVVDPVETLTNWWRILKPGGYLIIAVPDEDMYEQGVWPPTFNTDHKHTYAVGKRSSWSPVSKNIDELVSALDGEIIKIERVEECFVFGAPRVDQTSAGIAESCIECVVRKPTRGVDVPTAIKASLRLCTEEGCVAPRHYENCPTCMGFGVYAANDENKATPLSASEACGDRPLLRDTVPCPTCGSTIKGAPR